MNFELNWYFKYFGIATAVEKQANIVKLSSMWRINLCFYISFFKSDFTMEKTEDEKINDWPEFGDER